MTRCRIDLSVFISDFSLIYVIDIVLYIEYINMYGFHAEGLYEFRILH